MPTEPNRPKVKRETERAGRLFPRGERGVMVCGLDRMMKKAPADRMLREDRHITKAALRQMADRLEHVRD